MLIGWGRKLAFRRRAFFTILLIFLLAVPVSFSAMIEVDGFIHNDTTWTDVDTVYVTNTVIVDSTAQLTIQPGTVILFGDGAGLWVWGQLYAEGEETDSIMFTSVIEAYGGTPSAGSWTGLQFYLNSSGVLRYCHFRYAINCVQTFAAPVEIYDCLTGNFSDRGFYIDGGTDKQTPTILERCVARQDDVDLIGSGTGIYVYEYSDIIISGCHVYNCQVGTDINSSGPTAPRFHVVDCDIRDNLLYGIYVHTCG